MAKSQKHGNREARKPKQVKVAQAAASDGPPARTGGVSPASRKRP